MPGVPSPHVVTMKNVPRHCQMSSGRKEGRCKITLSENHQFSGWIKKKKAVQGKGGQEPAVREKKWTLGECTVLRVWWRGIQVGVAHSGNVVENSAWGLDPDGRQKGI